MFMFLYFFSAMLANFIPAWNIYTKLDSLIIWTDHRILFWTWQRAYWKSWSYKHFIVLYLDESKIHRFHFRAENKYFEFCILHVSVL